MAVDSPLAYRFVAAPDNWDRNGGAVRAIVCHMAQGGGTVSWLTRDDGNSSHYVVEYDGRITQMVRESRAAGSMNPDLTRTTNDAPFTFEGETIVYGITALKSAFGTGYRDPNRYAIAIEVEGYAGRAPSDADPRADPLGGPNDRQTTAIAALIADIRRRRGALPVIGHRDQQAYKACPGHRFPWAILGGHGGKTSPTTPIPTPSTEATVKSFAVPTSPQHAVVATGAWLYDNDGLQPSAGNVQISPGRSMPLVGVLPGTVRIVEYVDSTGKESGKAYFVKPESVTKVTTDPVPTADDGITQATVDKAVAAQKAADDQASADIREELAAIKEAAVVLVRAGTPG